MQNKLSVLVLCFFIFSCSKATSVKQELDNNCLTKRQINSVFQSCGGPCSINYKEKSISVVDSLIKIDFEAKMYLYEDLEDTFSGAFFVKCNDKKRAVLSFFDNESDENLLQIQTNGIAKSFQVYSDELCSCSNLPNQRNITLNQKHKVISEENCFEKSDFILPYNRKIDIETIQYSNLKCPIDGISNWFCEEEELRYKSIAERNNLNLILVPQDCGDFRYRFYLLIIQDNKVTSNLYVEGEWYEPEKYKNIELTSFEINEDYLIKVTTKNVLGKEGIDETKKYRITEEGKIVPI